MDVLGVVVTSFVNLEVRLLINIEKILILLSEPRALLLSGGLHTNYGMVCHTDIEI